MGLKWIIVESEGGGDKTPFISRQVNKTLEGVWLSSFVLVNGNTSYNKLQTTCNPGEQE